MKNQKPKTHNPSPNSKGFTLRNFSLKNLGGFTLLELIIFMAIFSLIAISFVAVLISILRVQNRETSVAEVNRQSQFIMTTLQRYIEESSLIETPVSSAPTSTLILRMASSSDWGSPYPAQTFIYLADSKVYLKEFQNGDPQALTSDRVIVDRLEFKKHYNPGAHDSVDITLALHYNSPNIQKQFAQLLQTSVARVSAASFDSDIMPSSTLSSLNIGSPGSPWKSINGIINFSNSNVGIGADPPSAYKLYVNGNIGTYIDGNGVAAYFPGKVGINTNSFQANPSSPEKLLVSGNIRLYGGFGPSSPSTVPCNSADLVGTIASYIDTSNVSRLTICAQIALNTYQWLYIMATSTPY